MTLVSLVPTISDFPAADDWDNEEYTGSLRETKVFTASGSGNKRTTMSKQGQQQQRQQQHDQQYQLASQQTAPHHQNKQAIGPNNRGGSSYATSDNLSVSHVNGPTQNDPQKSSSVQQQQLHQPSSMVGTGSQQSSVPPSSAVGPGYPPASQSIDLSTLLHKPTTQSSIGGNPGQQQQSLLQFTQQATDSLKAAVGIGQGQQQQQPKV